MSKIITGTNGAGFVRGVARSIVPQPLISRVIAKEGALVQKEGEGEAPRPSALSALDRAERAVRLHKEKSVDDLLFDSLLNGKATVEFIRALVAKGANLNSTIFAKLATNEATNIESIEQIIRHIIESGVKANPKLVLAPLQSVVDVITMTTSEPIKQKATKVAIALLKNGAGFKLEDSQKQCLVEAIFKHDPEYIKTLLTKGWIAKDFKIDGVEIAEYAPDNEALAAFIAAYPSPENFIDKKKRKSLADPIWVDLGRATKEDSELLRRELVSGVNINKDTAKFSVIRESEDGAIVKVGGRIKRFLEKRGNSSQPQEARSIAVIQHFGNQLLRILSNRQYAIKRGAIVFGRGEEIHFATKWDDSIAENYFGDGRDLDNLDKKFLKNYARLCGVNHVLGEYDWNYKNFLVSAKTGKPVKIDNMPLINGLFPDLNRRIYGSYQSRSFLYFLAGRPYKDTDKGNPIYTLLKHIKRAERKRDVSVNTELFNTYIEEYNKGIDDGLLESIKQNIAKNPSLKDAFIEFMKGVQDTIDLAADKEFLKKYSQKYRTEIGQDAYLNVIMCCKFLRENAEQAKGQFKEYLAYYKELILAPSTDLAEEAGEYLLTIDDLVVKEDVEKYFAQEGCLPLTREKALEQFKKVIIGANLEAIKYFYDQVFLHKFDSPKNPALIAVASLLANDKIEAAKKEKKAVDVIAILKSKGCIPSNTNTSVKKDGLSYPVSFLCGNYRNIDLFHKQFAAEEILGPLERDLFKAIENSDHEQITAQLKALLGSEGSTKVINLNAILNKEGLTPLAYAISIDDAKAVDLLVKAIAKQSRIESELNELKSQALSALKMAVVANKTNVVRYFLAQGYYNLDSIFQYKDTTFGREDSEAGKIIFHSAALKRIITNGELNSLSKEIVILKYADLKSLVKGFSRDEKGRAIYGAEGWSFLQIYVQRISDNYVGEKAISVSTANISSVIKLFAEKGLDVNAKISRDLEGPQSLLQYALNAMKRSNDFRNISIAIALIDNGAKFNDLTKEQKATLVRAAVNKQTKYLTTLLEKGIVDPEFVRNELEFNEEELLELVQYIPSLRANEQPAVENSGASVRATPAPPSVGRSGSARRPTPMLAGAAYLEPGSSTPMLGNEADLIKPRPPTGPRPKTLLHTVRLGSNPIDRNPIDRNPNITTK